MTLALLQTVSGWLSGETCCTCFSSTDKEPVPKVLTSPTSPCYLIWVVNCYDFLFLFYGVRRGREVLFFFFLHGDFYKKLFFLNWLLEVIWPLSGLFSLPVSLLITILIYTEVGQGNKLSCQKFEKKIFWLDFLNKDLDYSSLPWFYNCCSPPPLPLQEIFGSICRPTLLIIYSGVLGFMPMGDRYNVPRCQLSSNNLQICFVSILI